MAQALNNIDGSVVGYTPLGPEFEQLVADTLGDAGDVADGFEAAINAIMATFPSADQGLAALDSSDFVLSAAIEDFSSIDTASWATEAISPLPVLPLQPQAPYPLSPGGIQLPSLPTPPNSIPSPPPPTQCVPAPPGTTPPSGPARRPLPIPIPRPPSGPPCPPGSGWNSFTGRCQKLCPPGYSFTADGNCTPSPVSQPGVPPTPPVQLPPIPQGLPPCPQGFMVSASGDCLPTGTDDSESKLLTLLGQELLQLTSKEVVPVTAAWVNSFVGLSAATSVLLVGAIIGVAGLLISLLGGGCGEACIDASKIEQVYEAIGDNIYRVARNGMIGGAEAVVAITHFMGVGDHALQRLGTDQAVSGQKNMDQVMADLIAKARALPATAVAPLDLTAAKKLYVGGTGWYDDSIQVASQVTTQFLAGLQAPASA